MKDLMELLMLLLVLGCLVAWIVIGVGILLCRRKGKCPEGRLCKNKECQWGYWCPKYQRFFDKEKYLFELAREYCKKMKLEKKR